MLVHATVEKMTAMHLTAMADAFQRPTRVDPVR